MKTRKKNITLAKASQIDGKTFDPHAKPENAFGTLDQILGESISVYRAKNTEEYKHQLADMNQTDLQAHALKIGLIPIEDRKVLVGRLIQEFERHLTHLLPQGNIKGTKQLSDLDDNARKILREGA